MMRGRRAIRHALAVLVLSGLMAALAPQPASAATVTWTGATNGNWATATNWVGNVAPVTGDDVVLTDAGNSPTNNDLALSVELHSVTISSGPFGAVHIGGNPIKLQSGGSITVNDPTGTDYFLDGGVTLTGPATITVGASVTTTTLNIDSPITGTGPLTLVNDGLGSPLQIFDVNTYTGSTTVSGSNAVRFVQNGGVPTGSALTVTGSALFRTSSTIGSLAGSGTVTMGLPSDSTLTVGGDNTDTTFSGVFQAEGGNVAALTKTGTGTLTLSGANTHTGGTTIDDGTIIVSADSNLGGAAGGLTFDGGTLQYGASFSSARAVTLNAGGGTIDTNGNNPTLSGVISGTGGLTKTGGGTVTLSGANTYTGATTVSAGTLTVTGSTAAGTTITVETGGTLGGSGTINGDVVLEDGATLGSGITISGAITPASFSSVSIAGLPATIDQDPSAVPSNFDVAIDVAGSLPVSSNITLVFDEGTADELALEYVMFGFSGFNPVAPTLIPSADTLNEIIAAGPGGSIDGPFTLEYTVPMNPFAFAAGPHTLQAQVFEGTNTYSSATEDFDITGFSGCTSLVPFDPPDFDAIPDEFSDKIDLFGLEGSVLPTTFIIESGCDFTIPAPRIFGDPIDAGFAIDDLYEQLGLDAPDLIYTIPPTAFGKSYIPEPYFIPRTPTALDPIVGSIFTPIVESLPPDVQYHMPLDWSSTGSVPENINIEDVILKLASGNTASNFKLLVNDFQSRPPAILFDPPGDAIARFFEVNPQGTGVDFGDPTSFEEASMEINVESDWIDDNNLDIDTVTLSFFDELDTEWSSEGVDCTRDEDEDTATTLGFECTIPHFSTYSVTADEVAEEEEEDGGSSGGGGGGGSRTVIVNPQSGGPSVTLFPESYFEENPLDRIQVSNSAFINAAGVSISQANVGQQVGISGTFTNYQEVEQDYAFIAQITDEEGSVVYVSWQQGTVESGQTADVSTSWTPMQGGSYNVQIFIWNGVGASPTPLSAVAANNIQVTE